MKKFRLVERQEDLRVILTSDEKMKGEVLGEAETKTWGEAFDQLRGELFMRIHGYGSYGKPPQAMINHHRRCVAELAAEEERMKELINRKEK